MINGSYSQSLTVSYTYGFQAKKEGTFTIPPASVTVNGKVYKSNSLQIKVVKGANIGSNNQNNNNRQNQRQNNQQVGQVKNKDLFVRFYVNKDSLYVGEPIYAVTKIYTRVDLSGFNDMKLPEFQGFYKQELDIPQQISLEREVINGEIYNVGTIHKVLLFPLEPGEITIDPFEIECVVRVAVQSNPRNIYEQFFFGHRYEEKLKKISTPGMKIKVMPLPVYRPASFTGGVGSFDLDAEISDTVISKNEGKAVSLKVKVDGTGNTHVLEEPNIKLPEDVIVVDPITDKSINPSAAGMTGYKSYEHYINPKYPGKYVIEPIVFSFFNPAKNKYDSIIKGPFSFYVTDGNISYEDLLEYDRQQRENPDNDSVYSVYDPVNDTTILGFVFKNKAEINKSRKVSKEYLKHIKKGDLGLHKPQDLFFRTTLYYLVFVIGIVLFALVYLTRREMLRRNADLLAVKSRKAARKTKKTLRLATKELNNNNIDGYYDALLKALWGFMSDKLSIPASELSKDNLTQILNSKNIEEQLINEYLELITMCEFARYAPSSDEEKMKKVHKNAFKLISQMVSKL
jgi:hypothetical protein